MAALVLSRRIFPQEFLVTHFDQDRKVWIADATNSDFQFTGASRNEVMDKVYAHVMTPVKRERIGRPKRNKLNTMLTLTPEVRTYLGILANNTGTSMSTMVSYLVTKCYAAYKLQTASELPEDERYGSDDDAWVQSQFKALGMEPPAKTPDAGRALEQLRAEHEEAMTALASKIREQIDAPKVAKEQEFKAAKVDLMAAEIKANKELDRRD